MKALSGRLVQADTDHDVGRYVIAHGDPADEATAAWVMTTPRPFESMSAEDADRIAKIQAGADAMGVLPPSNLTDGVEMKTPPWTSEKAAPLAPTQRWGIDLRRDSALSEILRRKLGRDVLR
jgi:hypothetical protein